MRALFSSILLLAAVCAWGLPACGGGSAAATACDAGFATCDTAAGSSCQTSLADTDKNCGRCGHDCLGGGCSAGTCQESGLVSAPPDDQPWGMGVDESGVYWATAKGGTVRKLAKDAAFVTRSGVPVTLATVAAGSADLEQHSLAVGGGKVYWASPGGTLYRVSTAGGAAETVAGEASAIAADASNAYFIKPSDGSIWKVPHAGVPSRVASAQAAPLDIAADASSVFWVNNGTAANHNTDGSVQRLLPDGTIIEVSSGEVAPEVLGAGSGQVYWCNKAGELRGKALTAQAASTVAGTLAFGTAAMQIEGTQLTYLTSSTSSAQPGAPRGGALLTLDLSQARPTPVYHRTNARAAAHDSVSYYLALGYLGIGFLVK